jgi:Zn-dependent protease with chaperone function
VNTTAATVRDAPGLTWRSLASLTFGKWGDGILGGLLVGWTYLPIALWFSVFFALGGFFVGALGGATSGIVHTLHIGPGVGFGAGIVGLFVGAFAGLVFIYVEVYNNLPTIIGGLISGLAVSLFTLWLIVQFEDQLLRLRGYRELSRREKQLIDPIVDDILQRMNIVGPRPAFYVSDSKEPAAWTHAKSIVLAQGLLGAYDDSENPPMPDMPRNAFAAVVAHEVSHWARADGVGIRAIWACCWPIVAVYNLACILGRNPNRKFTLLGWILFWPAWVSINLVVIPMLTTAMRQSEYEADARAASLGDEYRAGLRTALGEFQEDWERPRTGWEDVLHATHPPIEHRLQQLEYRAPAVTVHLSAEGRNDLHITDPTVLAIAAKQGQAVIEGNTEREQANAYDQTVATAAWLRQLCHALAQGQAIPITNSRQEIEEYAAQMDQTLSAWDQTGAQINKNFQQPDGTWSHVPYPQSGATSTE